jgi:general secretion pathway protein D
VTVVLALVGASFAQDKSTDQAKSLLEKGINQYKSMEFKAAKEILLSVERTKLPADGQKSLDTYLNQVDGAIRQQAAANEAFQTGEKALAKNDLPKAREGYAAAANSEYLQPQMRQSAKAQLALVDDRIKLQAAPTTPPAVKATPAPTPAPAPKTPAATVVNGTTPPPPVKPAPTPRPRQAAPVPPVRENPVLTRVQKEAALAQQEANLQFQKHMMEVSEHLLGAESEKDFDAATSACREAREVLESNKDVYTIEQYRAKMAKVEDQLTYIDQQRAKWSQQKAAQTIREIDDAKAKRQRETQERRRMDIERLTHEAKVLIHQKQYGKAVEMMDQIKALDPNSQWVEENEDVYKELALLRDRRKINQDFQENRQRQHNIIAEAEVPWWRQLVYPEDWRELTVRRDPYKVSAASSTEAERAVDAKLHQRIPKLDFDDTEFSSVVTFLRETSGLDIDPHWAALDAAGLGGGNSKTAKVSVHLTDKSFETVLNVILDKLGGGQTDLKFIVDKEGTVLISTKEDLSTDRYKSARVYDISDLLVRVPMIPGPVLDLSQSTPGGGGNGGGSGGGTGIFGSNTTSGSNTVDNNPTKQQVLDAISNAITNSVEPESWKPNGQVGSLTQFGSGLVIQQTADAHAKISNLLAQLRETRSIQISVEARFIEVDSGFLESIGVDLNAYFNLGSHTHDTAIRDPFTGVMIDPSTGQPRVIQTGTATGTVLQNSTIPGTAPNNSFTQMWGSQNVGSITSAVNAPSMQVSGAFLDDIQVAFLLQATQANSSTRTLTAPHLTLFNGQRAYVTVGSQFAYVSNFIPIVSENQQSAQPIVSWIPTGSVLDVEATVTADRRYVTMTIRPQVSSLIGTIRDVTVAGSTIELPNINIKKLETTVNIPDGGTLLLGGQKSTTQVENEQGVPLLSKIPIVNRLFTNRGTSRDESTLLILVKPKIMIMPDEENMAFPP